MSIWSLAFVSVFGCLQLQGAGSCLQPLFPGESGVDQLVEIIKVLGTPTGNQVYESQLHRVQVPSNQGSSLAQSMFSLI